MTEIEPLYAWQSARRELTQDVAAAITASGVAKVTPTPDEGWWMVETESKIGLVAGESWELRIHPHLRVPKLLFLLSYSLSPRGWRDTVATFEREDDVVSALASAFAFHAGKATEQGLLRGYVVVEERRNDLRGRVRFGDQLARLPGLSLPLEVAYDDFTANVPENRLLRTAAEILLRLPRVPTRARSRLLHLRALLDEVEVFPERRGIPLPGITRLNERYEPALRLAKLVLDASALRLDPGKTTATSFVFDMNEIFESFVWAALREALRPHGGTVERQWPGWLDIDERWVPLRADIVWRKGGRVRSVIDSKYKPLAANKSMPNADAYQMLAYCIGFGVRRGFLVYAREAVDRPDLHRVKRHGYEVDVQAIDVEQEPDEVIASVETLAALIATSAAPHALLPAATAVS